MYVGVEVDIHWSYAISYWKDEKIEKRNQAAS